MELPAKTHLFEQIHEILWDKIRSGDIVPGQRMKDIDWAQKLSVSRTPVREAMRKMQQEGVLIPLAQGGYEVRRVSRADLINLYRCRAAMEALATEDAAARFDDTANIRLTKLVARCDEAIERGDFDKAFALNTEFHTALIDMSDNEHLKSVYDSLRRMILFYRTSLLNRVKRNGADRGDYATRLRIKQQRHREILAALKSKDGARAAKLMESHVRETAEDLLPAVPATQAQVSTDEAAA